MAAVQQMETGCVGGRFRSRIWLHGDGDMVERIECIMLRGLTECSAVIALGAGSPAFRGEHLDAALESLASHDAVVGPSTDGGFYLLGLRRSPGGLFSSLPWSTGETLRALQERLRETRFFNRRIAPLFDVDTPTDQLTRVRLPNILPLIPTGNPLQESGLQGPQMRVSIIVPASNEEQCIAETRYALHQLEGEKEVIMVDAGSQMVPRPSPSRRAQRL